MSYRNERFNRSMRSLEVIVTGITDVSKAKVFSDCGTGVRRMLAALDWDTRQVEKRGEGGQRQEDLLFNAEMRLVEAGKRHLIPVLLLIVENGANREESMKRVPKRTYFRHREALLRFFSGTRVHMDI